MDEEQTVSHNIIDSLKAFDNDYLAEVFRLWNCDIRDWHDPYVAVFRFESNDVMIWKENGVLRYHLGAIDIDSAFDSLPAIVEASINFDTCLSWLRDKSYAELIGSTNVSYNLLKQFV